MHIHHIGAEGQFVSCAQSVYSRAVERLSAAYSVHLQEIASGLIVGLSMVILPMPLDAVCPTFLTDGIITATQAVARVMVL